MKILIIGNGFDLAHSLPTTYNNFLDVCDGIISEDTPNPLFNKNYRDFCDTVSKIEHSIFKSLVNNNSWIEHFRNNRKHLGDKWGDFESEIEYVVKEYNKQMEINGKNKSVVSTFSKISHTLRNKYPEYNNTYNQLFTYLSLELKQLTSALDMYFHFYIDKKEIVLNDMFLTKDIDKCLSFNYSSTYVSKYPAYDVDDFECCYIHGESTKNNIVLGFDDHYLITEQTHIKTVPFEKYYQRIIKSTDNKYIRWLDEINQNKISTELIVFGHSLTPADGDVLVKFFSCPYIKTIIYYVNQDDLAEKVANLAVVLGPDKLIELAGGLDPIIKFLPIKEL